MGTTIKRKVQQGGQAKENVALQEGEPETLSVLRLRGLGKELWKGSEAAEHVALERDSWIGEDLDRG